LKIIEKENLFVRNAFVKDEALIKTSIIQIINDARNSNGVSTIRECFEIADYLY
jgi:hypothetical protein